MKAVGQFTQGIAAYDAGKYSRKVMRVNARNRMNDGVAEQEQIRFAARQSMGRQLVAGGSSGFQLGTGSALDALFESAANREMDLALSRRRAESEAAGFRQSGDLAYAQGKSAMVGGMISGAATVMEQVSAAFGGGAGGGAAGAAGAGGAA